MKIQRGAKLLFIGDSITDAGRVRPVAEGLFDPLGKGYVSIVSGLIGAACPELGIRIVNMGCSGNTVRDLKARWDSDVMALKPDWLSVMIGINDVWRQFDLPLIKESHVLLEEYELVLEELAAKARPSLKGLVLMSPYFIEPNKGDAMRAAMDAYGAAVKRVASKRGAVFVDVQAAFDEALKHCHPAALAWDRVHPNATGHSVIARAFLKAVEMPW